jgi:hypothetical protein
MFKFVAGEMSVPLRRRFENDECLAWTWRDGIEYAVTRPQWPHGWMHIVSGENIICCGRLSGPRLKDRVTMSQWVFDGQTIVWEGGALCCKMIPRTHMLRREDGVRLAFLVPRNKGFWAGFTYEGVLRDGLPDAHVPIVLAIIFAGICVPMLTPTAGD